MKKLVNYFKQKKKEKIIRDRFFNQTYNFNLSRCNSFKLYDNSPLIKFKMKKLFNYFKQKKRIKKITNNFVACAVKDVNYNFNLSKYNRIKLYDNRPLVKFNKEKIYIMCNIPNSIDGLNIYS